VKIEGISELARKDLEQLNAACLKVLSLWAATFNTRMSAEIAIQNSKLLTGQYSPDEYIRAINPVWAENQNEIQRNGVK
jgi:raffinose/stachyose/melibiose transport system substrate-binding protein